MASGKKRPAAKTASGSRKSTKNNTSSKSRSSASSTRVSGNRSSSVKNASNTRANSAAAKRARKQELERQKQLRSEIILIAIFAFSVFMLLANFNICGIVGSTISGFFFGILGFCQYFFPVYLFVSAAFLISNDFNKKVVKKVVYFGIVLILVSMLFQAIYSSDFESVKVLYLDGYKNHAGGGVICGGLFFAFRTLLGVPGACIVMFILAVIMFILITEISLIEEIKKLVARVRDGREYDDEDELYDEDASDRSRPRVRNNPKEVDEYEDGMNARKRAKPSMASLTVYGSNSGADDNVRTDRAALTVSEKTPQAKPARKDFFYNEDVHELASDSIAATNVTININEEESYDDFSNDVEKIVLKDSEEYANPVYVETPDEDILAGAINGNIHPESVSDYKPDEAGDMQVTSSRVKKSTAGREGTTVTGKTYNESRKYKFPTPALLSMPSKNNTTNRDAHVRETAIKLKNTLETFGVNVTITNYSCGPAVTRFEMQPEQGVKVSKILSLADDIKLNLAASDIRIEAPIPGKAAIGIEVPNKENSVVSFRELIESDNFKNLKTKLAFAVGKDISGQVIATDIAKMPHLLIAGATGSGKSVCINTLIMSILYKATPEEVKLIMIDPKMVELACYNGIPHLLIPVVTDPKKAAGALNWAVMEMTRRYQLFAEHSVRNIQGYNDKVQGAVDSGADKDKLSKLPQIVVIVDELADLMMVAHGEVEDAIVRLSQLARAAGIHLVIATQRPSVDVITGLIKANVPSRIAFAVSSGVDSRTILDMVGAEKLLGKGDMLFYPTGFPKPVRVQGAFISDDEVTSVVEFLKKNNGVGTYDDDVANSISSGGGSSGAVGASSGNDRDEYFVEAGRFIIEKEKASIGMLQRTFKIGFNRAARIMDQLTAAGVVGPEVGTKARSILMTQEQFDEYIDNNA
ncbi:MAG: DNA translocase FtsK [Coprococcus sp.]|nr:DNA translocase FtsK [Coprococcus sp.]